MLSDGVYTLTQDVKNTVAYLRGSKRWEHLRLFKAGMEFRVVTNLQYGTKHLSPVRLYRGWNIVEGPLFALLTKHLQLATVPTTSAQ